MTNAMAIEPPKPTGNVAPQFSDKLFPHITYTGAQKGTEGYWSLKLERSPFTWEPGLRTQAFLVREFLKKDIPRILASEKNMLNVALK